MATILIVDDRQSNREFLLTLLGYGGHRLLQAGDGAQALDQVRAERPDLVITDILMPKMDGYEFVQQLRREPALAATPVIFYTATYSEPEARALAQSCGVDIVLPKPCEPQRILAAVNQALRLEESGIGSIPAASRAIQEAEKLRPIDQTASLYLKELQAVTLGLDEVVEYGEEAVSEGRPAADLSKRLAASVAGMQRVMSRLSALIEVGMEMESERDPAKVVELFFAAACDVIDSKYAAVGILDEEDQALRHVFAKNVDVQIFNAGEARGGIFGSLLAGRHPVRGRSSGPEAGGLPPGHPPVRNLLALPVASANRRYGWIYFADKARSAEFSEEDERLASIMASKLALLYENVALYDVIQRHAAKLRLEVTERGRAQEALQESESALRRAQAMAKLAHVVTGPKGEFLDWSESLPALVGLDAAAIPADTREWTKLIHPEDRERYRECAINAARNGDRCDIEYRLRRDGGWAHFRQVLEPFVGQGSVDGPARWFNTIQDVTEQYRAAAEVRRFRLAMDNSADLIAIIDRTTMRYVDVNSTACRLLGYSRDELLGMHPQDLLPGSPDDFEKSYDALIADPETPGGMNSSYRCKDGSRLPFESTRHVLRSGDTWLIAIISRDIRQRLAAEGVLRESEARFRGLSNLSADWYWEQDAEHRFVDFSGGDGVDGWGPDQQLALGLRRWELPNVVPVSGGWDEHKAALTAHTPFRQFEYQQLGPDGSIQYVAASGEPVFDASGRFTGYRGIATDITTSKRADEKIRRLNRVYAVLSGINGAIVRIRDRDELFREACRIAVEAGGFVFAWLGIVDHERLLIDPIASAGADEGFLDATRARMSLRASVSDGKGLAALAVLEKRAMIANHIENDPRIWSKDAYQAQGSRSVAIFPLIVNEAAVGVIALHAGASGFFDDEEKRLLLELAGDIAFAIEHIEKSEKVSYLALYDELTGLANRALFLVRVNQSIVAERQSDRKFALAILDIERLRTINDSLGRRAGDALIKLVSERMKTVVGAAVMSRISTDHFALVLGAVKGRSEAGRIVMEFLQKFFGVPYSVADTELRISAKVGVALFPGDGIEAEVLLENAEAALRKGKASGERITFHAPGMTARTAETLTLENKLRRALEQEEFVLHYQPKVDLEARAIVGVEALIRWQSPELGLVPPMKFIPLMEETGMILEVGSWALKQAARDHRRWFDLGLKAPRVAVNVSSIQLRRRDFVASVEAAIIEGIAPAGIDLEITESLIMEDVQVSIEKLKAVRALGIGIAIDDFGTGYSSLGYLAKLPVQTLKIDRSFIVTMLNDPDVMSLVQMVISLAHSLRLIVVAEGVDREDQAKLLRLLRCDQMQGYLYSKPVPFEAISAMLEKTQQG